MVIVLHILLALSVAALAGVGMRLATRLGSTGLERAVVAAVCAAALAVLCALLLSTVALGASPPALSALAGLSWLAARRLLPEPKPRPTAELAGWWRKSPTGAKVVLFACAGAWAAWALWLARWPILGADSMIYHVPEIIEWIHEGTPGSISSIFVGYPVGAYPVTNEVLMTWPTAIARSFAPVVFWAPAMLVLLATAGWVGLRELRVPPLPAGLAVATVALTPALTHWQKNGAHTDLPALTWLVCTAALCAASARRPLLVAPMIVAASLGIGTKTTTAPLMLAVLACAVVVHRRRLSRLAAPAAAALAVGAFVGGFWYFRNLVLHGSPLWPFVALPWGDPAPRIIDPAGNVVANVYNSFLDTPGRTTSYIFRDYAKPFLGGIVLLAAALAAPLVVRRRPVFIGAGVVAAAALIWMNAPFTGVWQDDVSKTAPLTTMRYLVPCWAAAALTLALAARESRAGRLYGTLALALALAITTWQLFDLGYPSVPKPRVVVAGAAGALIGLMVARVLSRRLPGGWPGGARLAALGGLPALIVAGALLSFAGSGFADRYVRAVEAQPGSEITAFPDLVRWFEAQPEYREGDAAIAFNAAMNATLAGDTLQHRVDHISPLESCAETRSRLQRGWIVFNRSWRLPRPCLVGLVPVFAEGEFRVYAPDRLARSLAAP